MGKRQRLPDPHSPPRSLPHSSSPCGRYDARDMIPIGDSQRRLSTPYVTRVLLVVNALIFLYMLALDPSGTSAVLIIDGDLTTSSALQSHEDAIAYPSSPRDDFTLRYGAVPEFIVGYLNGNNVSHDGVEAFRFNRFTGDRSGGGVDLLDGVLLLLTPLTAMFLHAGWLHVIGNMLFLWVFGTSVEDRLGSWRFAAFYLVGGYAAAAAHIWIDSGDLVPMVGASGAISAVLGAYLLLFPRALVRVFLPIILLIPAVVPAPLMIGIWFALNLISGVGSLTAESVGSGGTAWWAHLGGFVAGMIFIYPFLIGRWRAPRQEVGPTWNLPPGVSGFWRSVSPRERTGFSDMRLPGSADPDLPSSIVVRIRSRPVRSARALRHHSALRVGGLLARRLRRPFRRRRHRQGSIDPYRSFDDH